MQKLTPMAPSSWNGEGEADALPQVSEEAVPTKIVAKPTLERKPKPVASKARKTVELPVPASATPAAPALKPVKAAQSLPKTQVEAIPQLQPLKAPEAAKEVPKPPEWPFPGAARPEPAFPPLTPMPSNTGDILKKAAADARAMATPEPAKPAAPPPLVKLQKGEVPTTNTPPALERVVKPQTPGIPPLERIVRTPEPAKAEAAPAASNEVVEKVVRKVEVIENVIRQDEMFIVYGISDGEYDFRGLYTRAHLNKLEGSTETDKFVQLLRSIFEGDTKDPKFDRAWRQRHQEGHISYGMRRGDATPYGKALIIMDIKDDDRGRSHAVWEGEDHRAESFIVYKYMLLKVDMNCRTPRLPLHLL